MRYKHASRPLIFLDFIALCCFFASGFTGLLYQICWIRKASLAFGSTTLAVSTVIAVFFAGLALGSYISGRYSSEISRPLEVYALLDILLGILILFNPVLFVQAEKLFGSFYPVLMDDLTLLSLARFLIIISLILPPTVLMGTTLPIFCRQYVKNDAKIGLSIGLLYGLNTFGAVFGCVTAGFFLIPEIGVIKTIWLGGTINLLIGIVILGYIKTRRRDEAEAFYRAFPSTGTSSEAVREPRHAQNRYHSSIITILFFLAGVVAIGNEIIWTRYLSLIFNNTVYTYTLTLTVTLTGIVLGSIIISLFADRCARKERMFGLIHIMTGLCVLFVLLLPAEIWKGLTDSNNLSIQFIVFNMVLLVPAILTGAAFPLAIKMVTERADIAAFRTGKMSAVNTAGGIAGSLLIGFMIFPAFGLFKSLLISTGISLVIGFSALIFLDRPLRKRVIIPIMAISIIAWCGIPLSTGTQLPQDFLGEHNKLVDFSEGVSANLAVIKRKDVKSLEIDRMWQGQNIKGHQVMAAHIPMLIHENPHTVLVVGAGVGLTAGRFLHYDIKGLDVVDIESELFGFVRRNFESNWMDDPRTRLIVDDGRNYINHTRNRYDIISIEIGQVFRPGLASFYTTDFYKKVKDRLNDGGIVCQFAPVLFFDLEEFRSVIRSFIDIFPESIMMYNTSEFLLVGSWNNSLKFSEKSLDLLVSDPDINHDLDFAYWGGSEYRLNRWENLAAGFLCGPEGLSGISSSAGQYRDDRPVLEYKTAANQTHSPGPAVNLIRQYLDLPGTVLDTHADEKTIARIKQVRVQNLNDINASYIARSVLQHPSLDVNIEEDIAVLENALEYNPQNIHIRSHLGMILGRIGRLQESIKHFSMILEKDSQNTDVLINLGAVYLKAGNTNKSLESLYTALELNPVSYEAHLNTGMAFQKNGDIENAINYFNRALLLNPDSAEAFYNLGNAMLSKDMFTEAIRNYMHALQFKPDFAEAEFNIGTAYLMQKLPDEAIGHYLNAVRIKPDYTEAYRNLAYAHGIKGEYREAVKYYTQIIQLDPNASDAYANIGDMFRYQENKEEAIRYYRLALKIRPFYPDVSQKLNILTQ